MSQSSSLRAAPLKSARHPGMAGRMNYRHAFHAGNFADVFKHLIVARIVEYLKQKPAAFRVIDTHAGPGFYDLTSDEAQRTGEWTGGVGRIISPPLAAEAAALAAPWLDAVRGVNGGYGIRYYPGSPALVRALLRPQDRLTAIELHPVDAATLRKRFEGDFQTRIIELDGWLALGAHLPPKEKRGLVLVDPPFEKEGEFDRLADGLKKAHQRWPGGIYALWYPIKDARAHARFRERLVDTAIPKIMDVTFFIRAHVDGGPLDGCGMVVVNPPYPLEAELAALLPVLRDRMADGAGAEFDVARLTPERL